MARRPPRRRGQPARGTTRREAGPGRKSPKPEERRLPLERGDTVALAIEGLGHSGEGTGRSRGMAVFVPYTVPGDEVVVRITEARNHFARGELLTVRKPSPERIQPPCPVFLPCGGCQLQQIRYRQQLHLKARIVKDALHRIAHLDPAVVRETLGAREPWHYRNKAQFPVGLEAGRIVAGCYARGTHRVIDTARCLTQHETNNKVIHEVKRLWEKHNLSVYNEVTGQGLLRHILVRVAARTGQAMVILVTSQRELPGERELARELMNRVPAVVIVAQNVNQARTNVVMGPETRLIAGEPAIEDHLGDLRFRLSPESFFQVNPEQARALYELVVDFADLSAADTAVDVYSGVGTITLFLARRAGFVYGIEVAPSAVADARENARLNRLDQNTEFLMGEAEDVLPRLSDVKPTAVVVNPPRKGCDPQVLRAMVRLEPVRIVYVSCSPASLARDLGFLVGQGYRVDVVQPVDMFPQTSHVEIVAKLTRDREPGSRDDA